MIQLQQVNKTYYSAGEEIHAIRDLTVSFPDQGLSFILGPSGSGKSTLLNLLGGLDKPTSGKIWIENREIGTFSQKELCAYLNTYLGFVFQEYNILKDLSLKENIALPLEIQNIHGKAKKEKVLSMIEKVGLKGLEKRKVSELSGGQKQRIAIARALVKNPRLIIADEPTGNLDSETSESIFQLLQELSKDRLIIVVTHDEESAEKYGQQIVRISPDGDCDEEGNLKASLNENTTKVEGGSAQ
jgi:putative ABC transport system permease protein